MPEQPDDYAIVIGLNDYPQFGSQGRPLAGAIEDAERFATWLKDTKTGGGLPQDNCKEILSTPDPLAPNKLGIDLALGSLITQAKVAGGGRRLYFYFSGHGQAEEPPRRRAVSVSLVGAVSLRRAQLGVLPGDVPAVQPIRGAGYAARLLPDPIDRRDRRRLGDRLRDPCRGRRHEALHARLRDPVPECSHGGRGQRRGQR